jgi:hypothetical protein
MITKTQMKKYIADRFSSASDRLNSIEKWLFREVASNDYSSIDDRLRDSAVQGCISGCVGSLIYNGDVLAFYQRYEAQIWETLWDYLDSVGDTLGAWIDSHKIADEIQFKVTLSWFAVETVAYQTLNHFEEEC